METKKYKLTINIGGWHKAILDAFCKRTAQNYTEAFKCWLAGLDGEMPDAEIDAIIAKLQARKRKRPDPIGGGGE